MGGENDTKSLEAIDRDIPAAFARWARTVFAAPRRTDDLITGIKQRDEVIERVATKFTRRTLAEHRTTTSEHRSTIPSVDPRTLQAFAHTPDSLRVASQYVAPCSACLSSGTTRCKACDGACSVTCHQCGGDGRARSEKTGRQNAVNCKLCKKSGRLPCGGCSATGVMACSTCRGSGHQLAWLTFTESEHWLVSVAPESPVVLAHRELKESRALQRTELSAFTIVDDQQVHGAIELSDLEESHRRLLFDQHENIDRRLERIDFEQYLRLAVIRRDVSYELAGTSGTVVFSGMTLAGSRTADALRPIRRRLWLWLASVTVVGIAAFVLRSHVVGESSFFEGARTTTAVLAALAVACSVPMFGSLLRGWRMGMTFKNVGKVPAIGAGLTTVALVALAVVGLTSRPSVADVDAALASGDVAKARIVANALREHSDELPVKDAEDRVFLAEAEKAIGNDRLKVLDLVAGRGGTLSTKAASTARNQRIATIQKLLDANDASNASKALSEWFAQDSSVEVREQRARVHEINASTCGSDPCRLANVVKAGAAHATDARSSKANALRKTILDGLAIEQVTETAVVPRLQRIARMSVLASETLAHVSTDSELQTRASQVDTFAATERAKVPLLGKDLAVATELLGKHTATDTGVPMFAVDGANVYLSVNKVGVVTGLYAVGPSASTRALTSATWPAHRILSQTLGRQTTIKPAAHGTSTSTWYDGAPIVVRWRGSDAIELRVGDSKP